MSSPQFAALIAEFPEERDTINRLEKLLGEGQERVVALDRMIGLVEPHSTESLALILAELSLANLLRRFVRVESPSNKGGIKDFPTLSDVPERIYDWRADREIDVTPENVHLFFAISEK